MQCGYDRFRTPLRILAQSGCHTSSATACQGKAAEPKTIVPSIRQCQHRRQLEGVIMVADGQIVDTITARHGNTKATNRHRGSRPGAGMSTLVCGGQCGSTFVNTLTGWSNG